MVNWNFQFEKALLVSACLEGFFYGVYSGIFVMYLHCSLNESRTATILFYALCLLYVLSTATVVIDLLALIHSLYIFTRSLQVYIDSLRFTFYLMVIQNIATGCCDFITQCIIIYRCWIVWGQNIRVVIIPSFLAIAFLGTWLAQNGSETLGQGRIVIARWDGTLFLPSFALSMAVNALVTVLIVFKILKVFLEVKTAVTSVDRTLGSTRGAQLRYIIFIIIESGMALFAIQLLRVVLLILSDRGALSYNINIGFYLPVGINHMINGIAPTIILVRVSMRLSFEDQESLKEAAESLCFDNPPSNSDPNTHRMGGSHGSMPHQGQETQERSEDT